MKRIFVPPTTIEIDAIVHEEFWSEDTQTRTACFTAEIPHVGRYGGVVNVDQALTVLAAVHLELQRIWVIQE